MLPTKIYESIRWLIAIFLPATGILLTTLAGVWGWESFPAEEISLTLDAIGLFLGTVFGISKIVHDKES